MDNGFPKFQWSIFPNGNGEQYVVRGNNWEDFILDIEGVKTRIQDSQDIAAEPPVKFPVKPSAIDKKENKVLCKKCRQFYHDPKWDTCWKCKTQPGWDKTAAA